MTGRGDQGDWRDEALKITKGDHLKFKLGPARRDAFVTEVRGKPPSR